MSAPPDSGLGHGAASPASNSTSSLTPPQADQVLDDDNQSETDTDSEADPKDVFAENYRHGSHTFNFLPLDAHITTANAPYLDNPPSSTRAAHNTVHASLFTALRNSAVSNPTFPTALFTPPRSFVRLYIQPFPIHEHYCCPCDLDENLAAGSIDIRAPADAVNGITTDLFLGQVGAAMYGESWSVGGEDDRPVIERFDFMDTGAEGQGSVLMGHIWALTRGFGAAKAVEEKAAVTATTKKEEE